MPGELFGHGGETSLWEGRLVIGNAGLSGESAAQWKESWSKTGGTVCVLNFLMIRAFPRTTAAFMARSMYLRILAFSSSALLNSFSPKSAWLSINSDALYSERPVASITNGTNQNSSGLGTNFTYLLRFWSSLVHKQGNSTKTATLCSVFCRDGGVASVHSIVRD